MKKTAKKLRRARLVPRGIDDAVDTNRTGQHNGRTSDLYARLLSATWGQLFCIIAIIYLCTNLLYATLYLTAGSGITNARPGSFMDAFFFSVQTMSTIGYGNMAPSGLATNLLVTLEVLTGFTFFALVTGMVFSKFARPTARVLFSEVAVICPFEGATHLIFRMANERANRIVDANVHVVLLRKVVTAEGHQMRKFFDLDVVRSRNPILQLSWSVMHRIDGKSPLHGATPELLREWDAEIIVSLTGIDSTLSQNIHAQFSYVPEDIVCNATFVDIIKRREDGSGIDVDYGHFHDVVPMAAEHETECLGSKI